MAGSATDTAAPRQSSIWRRIRLVVLAAAVAALAAWALWPRPVGIDVATVARGPMAVAVEEEAKTRIKDVFVVSAPQSGIVRRSPLLAGDRVEKDKTLVALLEPAQPPFLDLRTRLEVMAQAKAAEAAVRLAEAELAQARADLRFADAEVARARALAATAAGSEKAREKAEHEADVARAAVAKADANIVVRRRQLESIEVRLVQPGDESVDGVAAAGCCVEVHAPASGRVLRVHQTSEQVIPAGTPLAEIGDPASIEIVAELLSTDAVKVSEGASVEIDGWGGGAVLPGRVRRIETAGFTKVSALGIEEQRVRVVIDLAPDADRSGRLGHEFRVLVRIRTWGGEDVVQVPLGALFRHEGVWSVFRVSDGRARRVPVAIGHRSSRTAEVVSGLAAGDRVVVYPSDRVVDGGRIAVRNPERGRPAP